MDVEARKNLLEICTSYYHLFTLNQTKLSALTQHYQSFTSTDRTCEKVFFQVFTYISLSIPSKEVYIRLVWSCLVSYTYLYFFYTNNL